MRIAFTWTARLDNYGTQYAGEYREQLTLTINDPLHWADRLRLTGQFASSFDGSGARGTYGGADYEIPLFSPNDFLHLLHLTNAYNVGAAAVVANVNSSGRTRVDEVGYRHDFARTRLGSASIGIAFNVKSATFDAPPAVLYDDKLTTARIDAQWERIDTRFRGVDRATFSYTHGFNDLLGSLDAYDPEQLDRGLARQPARRIRASSTSSHLQLQRLQRITQYTSLVLRVDGQYTERPAGLARAVLDGRAGQRARLLGGGSARGEGRRRLAGADRRPAGHSGPPAFGNNTWGQVLQFSVFVDYADGRMNPALRLARRTTS